MALAGHQGNPTNGGGRQLEKAVYILDNRASKYNVVKPMVRMWGTGTLHVDNIYFGFIDEPAFFLPEGTPHMKVENWQPGEN